MLQWKSVGYDVGIERDQVGIPKETTIKLRQLLSKFVFIVDFCGHCVSLANQSSTELAVSQPKLPLSHSVGHCLKKMTVTMECDLGVLWQPR